MLQHLLQLLQAQWSLLHLLLPLQSMVALSKQTSFVRRWRLQDSMIESETFLPPRSSRPRQLLSLALRLAVELA